MTQGLGEQIEAADSAGRPDAPRCKAVLLERILADGGTVDEQSGADLGIRVYKREGGRHMMVGIAAHCLGCEGMANLGVRGGDTISSVEPLGTDEIPTFGQACSSQVGKAVMNHFQEPA